MQEAVPTPEDSDTPHAEGELVSVSKLLAKVLRHEPEIAGVRPDAAGWVSIEALIAGLRGQASRPGAPKRLRTAPEITRELVFQVVAINDKARFTVSSDGQRIRAVQGHSIQVSLGHPVLEPPDVLFHGTAQSRWVTISKEGLRPGSRHAVHLTEDAAGAARTGARHGTPLVLQVDAKAMHRAGQQFSRSDNGVWLVDMVQPKYLHRARGMNAIESR